jgi:broad specificity phosphatase PhoE
LNKKTIYLIRHGETDFNRRGIVQGSGVDSELNELGHAQADAFYKAYQHVPFDKVYTSALRRTKQSVAKFITKNIPNEAHASLNEISWGIREGITPAQNDGDYYKFLTESWQNGQTNMTADGGESPEDVQKRQAHIIDLILSRPNEKLILVAMHGRAIRILLTTLLNRPLVEMDTFPHTNLGLYELQYDYDSQQFTVIRTNDTSHL